MNSATNLFEFLERTGRMRVERMEFDCTHFRTLRHSLRSAIGLLDLSDDPSAIELAQDLRGVLSEWLTAPVSFEQFLADQLETVAGTPVTVRTRWGVQIGDFYAAAIDAALELIGTSNPLRDELERRVRAATAAGDDIRIYCHRSTASHYSSFASQEIFLHSAAWYRRSVPFSTLFKVGPLRTRGWSSVPDAVISAPRFETLVQLVWAGSADEQDFGLNPVRTLTSLGTQGARVNQIPVEVTTTVFADTTDNSETEIVDELDVFSHRVVGDARKAVLVQIAGGQGILFAPFSHVLSFDPSDSATPFAQRLVEDELREGMFLVRHIGTAAGGEVHAEHGELSRVWKATLEEEYRKDPSDLCARLREAGIKLERLDAAIRHWCREPTTVIHAPQQRAHFDILIAVLKIEGANKRWAARAWNEIGASRGVAIVAGVEEREQSDQLLLDALSRLRNEVSQAAASDAHFSIALPEDGAIFGPVLFDKVLLVESGYKAPDGELRLVHDLKVIEQWRE